MRLQSYLDQMGVRYQSLHHDTAYTAQDLAAKEHISGKKVIKPVVVQADGQWVMCALPACYRIDMGELKKQLDADQVKMADEAQLRELFGDCEPGAEPPIGRMYGMPTVIDEALIKDDQVTFQAGTHCDAVTMTLADYRRIAQPEVAHFGRQM
ncbi:MAG TPA: YbaK/EbsC family protein [Tepidisphaeraceae bacterium]|jgi:Ala-tRNA(Pro) deacylase